MSDARLRELERRWTESGADEDLLAYDVEATRMGAVSPPRRQARQRAYGALLHRLKGRDALFWEAPSPVPTHQLNVYLNHQRITPLRTTQDLQLVRDSIRRTLFPPRNTGLGSQVRNLLDQYIEGPRFPFGGERAAHYVLENIGSGLLFAPLGWEPTAGDEILVQGVRCDESNNTKESIARLELNAGFLRWTATYGMVEVSFTLHNKETGKQLSPDETQTSIDHWIEQITQEAP